MMVLWLTESPGLRCFEKFHHEDEAKFWIVSADGVREEHEG